MDPASNQIMFGWWNTSLSPPFPKERTEEEQQNLRATAGEIVRFLIETVGVDCMAVGEVTTDDLSYLCGNCGNDAFASFDGTLKEGKAQFDTGVLYNSKRLLLADSETLFSEHGVRLKTANRLDLLSIETESPFHVFVSHWPSRGWCSENEVRRSALGWQLRDAIKAVRKHSVDPAIILLGDYNDEPFDSSLSSNLLATRDRRLAGGKHGYFYNPFWRHLGESEPYSHDLSSNSFGGSCSFASGLTTRWRTFDQIIFSGNFLGRGDWHLNEKFTAILRCPPLTDVICTKSGQFDHFPVISTIEWKPKGETDG